MSPSIGLFDRFMVFNMKRFHTDLLLKLIKTSSFGNRSGRFTIDQVQNATGVSRNTVYRWLKDASTIPPPMRELMEFKLLGILPDKAFDGWIIDNGKLISPLARNEGMTPASLDNITWTMRLSRWQRQSLEAYAIRESNMNILLEEYRKRAGLIQCANDESIETF